MAGDSANPTQGIFIGAVGATFSAAQSAPGGGRPAAGVGPSGGSLGGPGGEAAAGRPLTPTRPAPALPPPPQLPQRLSAGGSTLAPAEAGSGVGGGVGGSISGGGGLTSASAPAAWDDVKL